MTAGRFLKTIVQRIQYLRTESDRAPATKVGCVALPMFWKRLIEVVHAVAPTPEMKDFQ